MSESTSMTSAPSPTSVRARLLPMKPSPPVIITRRRDKAGKKRKKGKKSLVDQEAVAQNISRTLASIKGPVAKKGARPRDDGPSFRDVQDAARREEAEKEKTRVRVTRSEEHTSE